MTRKIKQLIFAVLFIAITSLIAGGIFFLVNILPSIIESRYHVEEEPEYVFTPVSIKEGVRFLSLGGTKASLMAEIINREPNYHADVLYEVIFFDSKDSIIDSKKGRAFVFSGESSLIHEGIGVAGTNVARGEVDVFETAWIKDDKNPKPPFPEVISFQVRESEGFLTVEGVVENFELLRWEEVKIIALFVDNFDSPVFSAHINLKHMDLIEARDFRIPISDPGELYRTISPEKTKIFVTAYGPY